MMEITPKIIKKRQQSAPKTIKKTILRDYENSTFECGVYPLVIVIIKRINISIANGHGKSVQFNGSINNDEWFFSKARIRTTANR